MKRVLVVGIATLDIVNRVARYPAEDEEVRAVAQAVRRGGNGANTAVVLAQQGVSCEFLGMLARDAGAEQVLADLAAHGVDAQHCPRVDATTPTSYISLSAQTGSRTIVHYRDLPEMAAEAMEVVDLEDVDWVHFEGRNVEQVGRMMSEVYSAGKPCSLEVEKPREGLWELLPLASVLMFSRPFFQTELACDTLEQARDRLRELSLKYPGKRLSLTWGADGAMGAEDGDLTQHAEPALAQVVDSIGAGDSFNAAIIASAVHGLAWPECVKRAVQLASRKCAQAGFSKLGPVA